MKKRLLSLALVAMLLAMFIPVSMASAEWTMYVYTENGRGLNVRMDPMVGDNVIGSLKYGDAVSVRMTMGNGWAVINWAGGEGFVGYVQSRFLVDYYPGTAPAVPSRSSSKTATKTVDKSLEAELASEKVIAEPFYIAARPTRTSGWVNFRVGPSTTTSRIRSLDGSKELLVIGETNSWYKARDLETNKVGYISKNYSIRLNKEYIAAVTASTADASQRLGTLNVNGAFDLTCKLPDGYNLQVVNVMGGKIIASILPNDITRPQMYLSIAYDDSYANVQRMNDLTADDLALLEASFTDMNQVEITYRETGHGTKLLVARETGSDVDFVDILAIYMGYFIEFNMTPNPSAAN